MTSVAGNAIFSPRSIANWPIAMSSPQAGAQLFVLQQVTPHAHRPAPRNLEHRHDWQGRRAPPEAAQAAQRRPLWRVPAVAHRHSRPIADDGCRQFPQPRRMRHLVSVHERHDGGSEGKDLSSKQHAADLVGAGRVSLRQRQDLDIRGGRLPEYVPQDLVCIIAGLIHDDPNAVGRIVLADQLSQ